MPAMRIRVRPAGILPSAPKHWQEASQNIQIPTQSGEMKVCVATVSILASRSTGRIPLSSTRPKLLLCSLAAGAFIATVALVHSSRSGTSSAGVTLTDSAVRAIAQPPAVTAPRAKVVDAHGTNAWPNPAQRAGPHDPEAVRTAARSAENAARAAAELAAK